MNSPNKLLAHSIRLLAVLCGSVSIALFAFAPGGSLRVIQPQWPVAGVLCWDACLSLLFFLQHSGMVRKGFRARLVRFIPPWYHPAIYAIASGIALAAMVVLWQPSGRSLLVLDGFPRRIAQGGSFLAVGFFVWGALALKGFDPFGLSPIRDYLRGRQEQPPAFVIRGPYRWVRHPLYFSILLLFWLYPDLTLDRLLFDILWTAWICVGTLLEEADLGNEFGDAYRQYRRTVPMLIPWRAGVAPRL
jgi:protein-S-isoprenylcysteine O-methyltransferase Ste14